MSTVAFHHALTPLFKHLGFAPTSLEPSDSYNVTFEQFTVNFLGQWAGHVLMTVSVGSIGPGERDELPWALLAQNLFDENFPPVQIGATARREIIVWSQARLDTLTPVKSIEWLDRFIAHAVHVAGQLNKPDSAAVEGKTRRPTENALSANRLQHNLNPAIRG